MKSFVAWVLLGLACSLSATAETAVTTKSTELKREPFSDAATLSTLPAQSTVEILKRQGGWTQVKPATAATGWVRMLSLRLGSGTATKQGDSGIGTLFNVARSGSSGNTVTTGVRGLSEEDLRTARPNPQELKRMQQFSVATAEAQKFAGAAGLQRQPVEYLKGGSGTSSSGSQPASSWGETQ
ncbi:MAG: SH3 domain-containing protein [Sulfurimicrobium sp.]|nr:SH3 domain-containing protein [Sulfurimicrobium sp.]